MKEIEEKQKGGRTSCVHGLEKSILFECPYYPK
jgi:hypothetical protein